MSHMNIPEEAVEAIYADVAKDARDRGLPLSVADESNVRAQIRKTLATACPFIEAQALKDAAGALDAWHPESIEGDRWDNGFIHAVDMLRDRADEIEEGK